VDVHRFLLGSLGSDGSLGEARDRVEAHRERLSDCSGDLTVFTGNGVEDRAQAR
jgi:hypothetical protein